MGVYWIEIGVNDTKNFILNAIINITIEDTTSPEWSSSLVNQVVDYGKNSSYLVDAWDLSGIAFFWINDTIHFDIDSTGLITNISSLRIGVYWIEIRAYDPYNNYCSAIIKLTVKDPAQQPDVGDIDYTTIIIIISIIGIPLIISIIIIVKKRK